MTRASDDEWAGYYANLRGRAPRALFDRFRSLYLAEGTASRAIDLGCGDGTETSMMLADGLPVTAVDGSRASIELLSDRHGPGPKLTLVWARLEDVVIPESDLIHSGLTLPFCPPESFGSLWERIWGSLRPGGLMAVNFGQNHGWSGQAQMTFLTPPQVAAFASRLDVLELREVDEIGSSAAGDTVRMHIIDLVARKPLIQQL